PHARDHLDIAERRKPALPPIDDASPQRETRQPRDECRVAAGLRRGVDEAHATHAALPENESAFHPGRTGADDEDVAVGVRRALEALGVPAAPELLAGRRILRA